MQDTTRSDIAPHHTPITPLGRQMVRVEYNLRGNARPLIALAAFAASFVFAIVPFQFDNGENNWRLNWFVAAPCIVGCFSCGLLFLRLLLGEFDPLMRWALLAAVFLPFREVGARWYPVVLLAGAAYLCMLLTIHFVVGDFTPVVRITKRSCNE